MQRVAFSVVTPPLPAPQDWSRREAESRSERLAAASGVEAGRGALAKLRKDHEGERERVKKVMGDLKKKMDRCAPRHTLCIDSVRFPQLIRACFGNGGQVRVETKSDWGSFSQVLLDC